MEVYGSVDIVVTSQALGFAPIDKITEELWDKVTGVKPKGHFNIIRHAVPYMKKIRGRIINCVACVAGRRRTRARPSTARNAGTVGLT